MAPGFRVGDEDEGLRVDLFLVRHIPGLGRSRARSLAASGQVRVNGRRVRKGTRLHRDDRVELDADASPSTFEALADQELELTVVHEDEFLVVVDKPPGVPSHPLRAEERRTVASALVARYPEMRGVGYSPREPGILHRLDTDTSGLLIAARSPDAFDAMRAQLRNGRVDKRYLALCTGDVSVPRVISLAIATDPADRRRVLATADVSQAVRLGALSSETELLEKEAVSGFSLVTARARRARRHQVRAHLAALGHPLVGDILYGGPSTPGFARHFLHASAIAFHHPHTGHFLELHCPLPYDARSLVDMFRSGG